MSNKGLETLYEWQMNKIRDGEIVDCWHWDIDDTETVILDLKSGSSNDAEILKRRGSDFEGELSRDYYQINFANKSGEPDETSDLPKYIQKYVNKVKEGL
tara:strand:- start:1046 stop:1345 length:300 start_codon:yes stop_codon:yes gene_type:complete